MVMWAAQSKRQLIPKVVYQLNYFKGESEWILPFTLGFSNKYGWARDVLYSRI